MENVRNEFANDVNIIDVENSEVETSEIETSEIETSVYQLEIDKLQKTLEKLNAMSFVDKIRIDTINKRIQMLKSLDNLDSSESQEIETATKQQTELNKLIEFAKKLDVNLLNNISLIMKFTNDNVNIEFINKKPAQARQTRGQGNNAVISSIELIELDNDNNIIKFDSLQSLNPEKNSLCKYLHDNHDYPFESKGMINLKELSKKTNIEFLQNNDLIVKLTYIDGTIIEIPTV